MSHSQLPTPNNSTIPQEPFDRNRTTIDGERQSVSERDVAAYSSQITKLPTTQFTTKAKNCGTQIIFFKIIRHLIRLFVDACTHTKRPYQSPDR